MNDVNTKIAFTGETLSLFQDSLCKDSLCKDSLCKESVSKEPESKEPVKRACNGIASCEADPAPIKGDANCLNVLQAELLLGFQVTDECPSTANREVRQLEMPFPIPIAKPNVLTLNDPHQPVADNRLAAHGKTHGKGCNMTRRQNKLSEAPLKNADTENSDTMTVGSINRTKPSPMPNIENSTRHLQAAMTLAQQLHSTQAPSQQGQCLSVALASSPIGTVYSKTVYSKKVYSEKALIEKESANKTAASPNEEIQTLNLRQRCLDDLEESRRFVKRSKESLVGAAKRSQKTPADKENQQQIGYQRSLLGYSASMDPAQRANLAAISSSTEKKFRVNVKKQAQQKRKQAGILICRHLVAALRIQAAHDQNTLSN